MIYFILILFFTSLIGISIMIGRKLILIQNGEIIENSSVEDFVPDFQEIKSKTMEKTERFSYMFLSTIIRSYLKSTNFLKKEYATVKNKIKNMNNKDIGNGNKEASKFLKMISDYKSKIRQIKTKIKEEENL